MRSSERMIKPSLLVLLVGIFLWFGATAQGADITIDVDTTTDDNTAGFQACTSGPNDCSLRGAISRANGDGANNYTINVQPGDYVITIENLGDDNNATGDLDILVNLTINGPLPAVGTATVRMDGVLANKDRIFHIINAQANLSHLTIQAGNTTVGGGINIGTGSNVRLENLVITNNTASQTGGGVYNGGSCYLVNVTVSGNTAPVGGGGIFNGGVASRFDITNSTLSGNSTAGLGGGIYNDPTGIIDIRNTTISGNSASGQGGGIYNASTDTVLGVSIYNATITSNNAAALGGAGIATQAGMYLINTIVAANNTGGDCNLLTAGILISGNNNLESAASCNFSQTFDLQNTNPLLNPLAVDPLSTTGTATHSLQALSPAINRGFTLGNITTDQRGVARAVQYDIGAYESDAPPFIDLSIAKAGPNLPVDLGANFEFNIRVYNLTQETTATGVTVTDTLDPKLSFVLPEPTGCLAVGQTITCSLPDVVGGSYQSVDIPVVSTQSGSIDNTASVTGNQTDPEPTNNSDTFTVQVNYPVPVITTLDPVSTMIKSPLFKLTVNGSLFGDLAKIRWNGSDLLTTFIDSTKLEGDIPTGLTAAAIAAEITVFNPEPGGGSSNPVIFNVYNPQANITSIAPTSGLSGGIASLNLTVNGSNFVKGAAVIWNGSPLTTSYVNSGILQAIITPQDLATAGTVSVYVENPAPALGNSNVVSFLVQQGYHQFLPLISKP